MSSLDDISISPPLDKEFSLSEEQSSEDDLVRYVCLSYNLSMTNGDAKVLLNAEQKKAVEHISGPVLVLAGPGTGKTQLLASRVAEILERTDSNANEILCLTFTDNAAQNMRERITKLIGSDAQRVAIHTFHSLGSEIINRFPEYFYFGAEMQPSDEVFQSEIIESLLQKLPHQNPLTKGIGSEFSQLKVIATAIDTVKKAGLSPDELREIIQYISKQLDEIEPQICEWMNTRLSMGYLDELSAKIETLPDQKPIQIAVPFRPATEVIAEIILLKIKEAESLGKTKPIGDWRTKWLIKDEAGNWAKFKERRKLEWWTALADLYEQYQQKMLESHRFDFADMIVQAVHKIESESELRAELQERWQYILIDEFQDTNAAQLRLAQLIADNPVHEGAPNIMVVGDDDQGIFKFQGAELDNISHFLKHYNTAEVIVLSENYRSHNSILELSRQVITQANDRLETRFENIKKVLNQSNKSIKKSDIKKLCFNTELDEHSWLAEQIKQHISSGVNPSEVAVISRSHQQLVEIAKHLKNREVAFSYERKSNILHNPSIEQILRMSGLVNAISKGDKSLANSLLGEVLSHPMWEIDHKDLWRWVSDANYQLVDSAVELDEDNPIRQITEWFLSVAFISEHKSLEYVLDVLVGSEALEDLNDFYSPYRHYFFNTEGKINAEYLSNLSALRILRNKLREYGGDKRLKIRDLIDYVAVLNRTGTRLVDQSTYVSDLDSVQLLTAHKAKGLEFDYVYVIGAQQQIWATPNNRNNRYLQSLPIGPAGDELDDFIRLIFVALTRAKSHLSITAHLQTESGKDTEPLLMLGGKDEFEFVSSTGVKPEEVLEVSWQDYHPLPANDDKVLLKPMLESYKMSVTHLLNFLNVAEAGPKHWLLTNLLQFPQAKVPVMSYGTAVHRALELGLNQYKKTDSVSVKELQDFFEIALNKEQLDKDEHERYLGQGKAHLAIYHQQSMHRWGKDDMAEMNFANQGVVIDGAKLGGKIDRIAKLDKKTLQVIDIKTGKALSGWGRNTGNDGMKTWKYRLQLIFYKILVENSREFGQNYTVSEGALEFTQPDDYDKLGFLELKITDEEVEHTKKLISVVWQKMQSLDLPSADEYGDDVAANKQFEEDLLS